MKSLDLGEESVQLEEMSNREKKLAMKKSLLRETGLGWCMIVGPARTTDGSSDVPVGE
jgi:hypothetical protein